MGTIGVRYWLDCVILVAFSNTNDSMVPSVLLNSFPVGWEQLPVAGVSAR